ncbi:hypothetical protein [Streptomyces sp. Ru87]|uniref:hypothetical protein n=1 Tax=Streptomyces sp. Ru87 TaxID=2044307 RepID=UPI0015D47895|nr:hypothetical protein [Streptomyces sp. Ru87]
MKLLDPVAFGVHIPVLLGEIVGVDDRKLCGRFRGGSSSGEECAHLAAGDRRADGEGPGVDARVGEFAVEGVEVVAGGGTKGARPLSRGIGWTAVTPVVRRKAPSLRSVHSGRTARTTSTGVSKNIGMPNSRAAASIPAAGAKLCSVLNGP